jgi:hypothetical protein
VTSSDAAQSLASAYLATVLPRRWSHVQAVAAHAAAVSHDLALDEVLVAAAWLHDIGYVPGLVDTGFHPLDGARFLRRSGVCEQVAALVAYHSCAEIEADVRGLARDLAAEFARPADELLADALCYCDMTTGPDGQALEVDDRLAEIRGRYGPGDLVTRSIDKAAPEIYRAVTRIRELIAAQPR